MTTHRLGFFAILLLAAVTVAAMLFPRSTGWQPGADTIRFDGRTWQRQGAYGLLVPPMKGWVYHSDDPTIRLVDIYGDAECLHLVRTEPVD